MAAPRPVAHTHPHRDPRQSGYATDVAPQSVTVTQTVTVDMFTSDTVRLVDPKTGSVIAAFAKRTEFPA